MVLQPFSIKNAPKISPAVCQSTSTGHFAFNIYINLSNTRNNIYGKLLTHELVLKALNLMNLIFRLLGRYMYNFTCITFTTSGPVINKYDVS